MVYFVSLILSVVAAYIFAILPSECLRPFDVLVPSHASLDSSALVILGFGYHRETNGYKVVRILFFQQNEYEDVLLNEDPEYSGEGCEVEVYTLGTNSWKKILVHFPWTMTDVSSGEFLDGCIHWMTVNPEQDFVELILAFDVGDEVFREIRLPDYRSEYVELDISVCVHKESLALFVYPSEHDGGYVCCYLWVMKEYGVVQSWTKQLSLVMEGVYKDLSFTKFEEILFVDSDDDMFLIDFKNGLLKYLGDIRQGLDKVYVVPFMESLVLLEGSLLKGISHKGMQSLEKCDNGSTSGEGKNGEL
ncbi:hypothetical protein F0562_020041 [Nyssa sinensis]|uniref:F-box associated beta-propeller type 1 domain-containing protein n=1 Tax=Nyssa sinensis TaxID=561372 RepID=A0A5J5BU25_9ASTE|nr:hypothetical protein F0562_020041 [Nyssa sinensis]